MDRNWFLVNLKEAKGALDDLVAEVESEEDSGMAEAVALAHIVFVYAKLNYAWNTRAVGDEVIEGVRYDQAVQFPKDFDL
jgi:hypothetical protein